MAEESLLWFYGRVWATFLARMEMVDDKKTMSGREIKDLMQETYNYEAKINNIPMEDKGG
jgi:hypothetical protein